MAVGSGLYFGKTYYDLGEGALCHQHLPEECGAAQQVFNADALIGMMHPVQFIRGQQKGTEAINIGTDGLHAAGVGRAGEQIRRDGHAGKMHVDGGGQRFPGSALNGRKHAGLIHMIDGDENPRVANDAFNPAQQLAGAVAGKNGGLERDPRPFAPQCVSAHGADHQLRAGQGTTVVGSVQPAQQRPLHQPGMGSAESVIARHFSGQTG